MEFDLVNELVDVGRRRGSNVHHPVVRETFDRRPAAHHGSVADFQTDLYRLHTNNTTINYTLLQCRYVFLSA